MYLTLSLKSAAGHRTISFDEEFIPYLAGSIGFAKNRELHNLHDPSHTSVRIGFYEDVERSAEDHHEFVSNGSTDEARDLIESWYE